MRQHKSFVLYNLNTLPEHRNEKLYIISFDEVSLYVGQCLGTGGYNLHCRLKRHWGIEDNNCLRANQRSGASQQFNTILNRLPQDVKEQFTITILDVHDLEKFVDLTEPTVRLKLISAGVTIADIRNNITTKKVIDICEKILSWSLCPVYCKAHYCDCTTMLPEQLIQYLLT